MLQQARTSAGGTLRIATGKTPPITQRKTKQWALVLGATGRRAEPATSRMHRVLANHPSTYPHASLPYQPLVHLPDASLPTPQTPAHLDKMHGAMI